MKIKKIITTLSLSAFLLSGLAVPTFAAESKPADSKTKAIQASILQDAISRASNLKASDSKSSTLKLAGTSVSSTATGYRSANTSLPGSDLWTHALKEGDNNYYWAYSYYYNSAHSHYSTATLNNGAIARDAKLAGDTSAADSDSYQSPFAFKVTAGIGDL